jgi:predicted membrane-bound spermidine synthase
MDNTRFVRLVAVAFLASGFSALVYQVVWQRVLTQVIGADAISAVLIVSIFMIGIGLGAEAGRAFLRSPRLPVAIAYAVLEVGIGIYGLLSLEILRSANAWWATVGMDSLLADSILNFVLLAPPIIAMGMRAPLVVHLVKSRLDNLGRVVGRLSGLYILGAAVGALVTGLVLIELTGLSGSVRVAAFLNIVVGLLLAWMLYTSGRFGVGGEIVRSEPLIPRAALAAVLFGFGALAIQIALFRVLTNYFTMSTTVFPAMLAAYLLLISLGQEVGGRLADRFPQKLPLVLSALFMVGAALLAAALILPPPWIAEAGILRFTTFNGSLLAEQYRHLIGDPNPAVVFAFSLVMMLSVLPWAALFPVMLKVVTRDINVTGTVFARLYSLYTAGNVLGAFIFGIVILPAVGTGLSVIFTIILVGVAAAVIGRSAKPLALVAIGTLIALFIPRDYYRSFSLGEYQISSVYEGRSGVVTTVPTDRFYEITDMNRTASASAMVRDPEKGDQYEAWRWNLSDIMFVDPDFRPRNILIIGIGHAYLVDTILDLEFVEKITIVDMSQEVVDAVRQKTTTSTSRVFTDPRVEIVVADGRRFVQRALSRGEKYDLVQIEINEPWNTASGDLFTSEFFAMQKALLEPGGYLGVRPLAGHLRDGVPVFGSAVFPGFYHVYFPNGPLPNIQKARITPDIAKAWNRLLPGRDIIDERPLTLNVRVFNDLEGLEGIDANTDDSPSFEYFWLRQLLGTWVSPRTSLADERFAKFEVTLHVTRIAELHGHFDPQRPGYGITDYPGNLAADIPKSYAKILQAELGRKRNQIHAELPDLGPAAGRWLLDNADLDNDGIVGWGVPIAWDAYGDGSVNPANTAYTISTAIVVESLLDWMEQDPTSPGAEILSVVEAALLPFADPDMRSPSGLAPYSFIMTDRQYDTFNPAAYLAGQLQRFSRITTDEALAGALRDAADSTVQALLDHRQINPATGSWYWYYSVQETVANDLPHASYIIHGLFDYAKYGGALSNKLDLDAVIAHIEEFEAPATAERETYIRGWPRLREDVDSPARSYDIGMAMSLVCRLGYSPGLQATLSSMLPTYRSEDGAFLKYPAGSDFAEPLRVNEYEAYLYDGAVACASAAGRRLDHAAIEVPLAPNTIASKVTARTDLIPFVHPFSGNGEVRFDEISQTYIVSTSQTSLKFADSELPLSLFEVPDGFVAFVRSMPDEHLQLRHLGRDGSQKEALRISASEGTEPIYRAASVIDDVLYLVFYDNIAQGNFLVRFTRNAGSYATDEAPMRLPSVQDPAGATYEMIPTISILAAKDGVHIVGGTLDAKLAAGEIEERRFSGCLKIIEAVATPYGPAVLCSTPKDSPELYGVMAPAGIELPELFHDSVPYALSFTDGSLSIKHADNADSYRDMLVFDIERIQQNGWLEYGISNVEARIPWSQIYYLNGFLDFVYLAERNTEMAKMVGDLAQDFRRRLDLEIAIADQHWREGRYQTRAFTIDRSPAIFAVQTSRLLLLMDRYSEEVQEPVSLPGYASLHQAVHCLENHIDVLAHGTEPVHWLSGQGANLRWPKGSKFYFDGVAVPFNHQNEWAYSVLRTSGVQNCPEAQQAAVDIIELFQRRIAPEGAFSNAGVWDYWWGTAYDGWTASDEVSLNKPEYPGDHIKAWISFRSIDVMSNLAASELLPAWVKGNLVTSAAHLVATGKLYPFVNYELSRLGAPPVLNRDVALRYARINSPWELQSAAWAYLALVNAPQ